MYGFQHPHVVTLIGVCLDGGPAPYIIMPFMANGSLLAYLRRNRDSLLVSGEEDNSEEVCEQVDIARKFGRLASTSNIG